MGCEKILGIKAELSPEAVIISVPFAPEAEAKVSVNIFFDNSFLFFFLIKNQLSCFSPVLVSIFSLQH